MQVWSKYNHFSFSSGRVLSINFNKGQASLFQLKNKNRFIRVPHSMIFKFHLSWISTKDMEGDKFACIPYSILGPSDNLKEEHLSQLFYLSPVCIQFWVSDAPAKRIFFYILQVKRLKCSSPEIYHRSNGKFCVHFTQPRPFRVEYNGYKFDEVKI